MAMNERDWRAAVERTWDFLIIQNAGRSAIPALRDAYRTWVAWGVQTTEAAEWFNRWERGELVADDRANEKESEEHETG